MTCDEKMEINKAVAAKVERINEALYKDDVEALNAELASSMVACDYSELVKPVYKISERGEAFFIYQGVKFNVRLLMDAMQAKTTDLYVITYGHNRYCGEPDVYYEQVVPDTEFYCLEVSGGRAVPEEILKACDEELGKWDNIEALLNEQKEA